MTIKEFNELKKGDFIKLKNGNNVYEYTQKENSLVHIWKEKNYIAIGSILYSYKDFDIITKKEYYDHKINYLKQHIKECEEQIKKYEKLKEE